jgi:hypothetical protein
MRTYFAFKKNGGNENELNNIIENTLAILETLPDPEFFYNLPLTYEDDFFFEGLIMAVTTNTVSLQKKISNCKNNFLRTKTEQLNNLKLNYAENSRRIFELESEIGQIAENDFKNELKKYKDFERLSNEKITPYFMKLVKQSCATDSLEGILYDETEYTNRDSAITGFYEKLYRKPEDNQDCTVEEIDEFLVPAVNNVLVQESKLNQVERNNLDSPLLIHELDAAINQSNKKSAPGTDGISNKFILKFWHLFRVPLHKYALACFEKGQLTINFRTAKIRLIPKKGDKTNLANWRPISLLNCFYKILSRAMTNRLKGVIDKVTKIGQMGYTNKKLCQEALMGILGGMDYAQKYNKKLALISLDIKKAFDSISHSFLEKTLEFFNFGPVFIK